MSHKTLENLLPDPADAIKSLRTIRDCIRWGASRFQEAELFYGHGTDNAFDEAAWLVLHALSLPLDLDDRFHDCRLTNEELQAVVTLLIKRVETREPAAYLTGEAWFCGLPFAVNEHVLVPRSPIGELIQEGFQPWLGHVEPDAVLDLCTGSACIGIACAYAFEECWVTVSDISGEALQVAQENVERHGLGQQVEVIQSDVFDALPPRHYDLIVSNPPYVDADDMEDLPDEFLSEPELGLAAGDDGLDIVCRILETASSYLTEQGVLVVEVGNSAPALIEAFPELEFTWPTFENGGHGVFVLTAAQLRQWQDNQP